MVKNRKVRKKILQIFQKGLILLAALFIAASIPQTADIFASRINELKSSIGERNNQIGEIKKEIEKYERQIDETLTEKKTLKNEIYRLQISAKKLNTDIYLTKKKIEASELNIEKLALEIGEKTGKIIVGKETLAEIIRNMNEIESQSLIEITLANDTLSDFFNNLEQMGSIQGKINANLDNLRGLKTILQKEKQEQENARKEQKELNSELIDQKIFVNRNKSAKNNLLKKTKNKEANYKKMLAKKKEAQRALEEEIREIEQQIQIQIDPDSLPKTGRGVLKWPLEYGSSGSCWTGKNPAKNCITQFFGNTEFATKNSQVYKGKGHRGTDFRARMRTKVKAAENGTVRFVYRDEPCTGGYYGGKWILIDHGNNLSTLYAHLNLIKVTQGQKVEAGETIGYSGQSGYVTGPHLHFTVFATRAVKVSGENGEKPILSKVTCPGVELKIPISPNSGYLNPLSYL